MQVALAIAGAFCCALLLRRTIRSRSQGPGQVLPPAPPNLNQTSTPHVILNKCAPPYPLE